MSPRDKIVPPILIIAYGNPLRCDDGIAWRAAEALERKFPRSQVEIHRLQQLAPEIADDLRQRDLVVFVDAACLDRGDQGQAGEIRRHEISGSDPTDRPPSQFTHVYSPARVLDLARELYRRTPKAITISVTGQHFEHGESLSPYVANALPELIATIERLVQEALQRASTTKDTN